MKTRIGSRRSISGRKSTPANNRALTNGAQLRINELVSRANDRHANALAVDGVEFLLWRKQKAGAFCTCYGENQRDSSVATVQDNEDGAPTTIDDLAENDSTKFGIVSLRDDQRAEKEAEGYGEKIYRFSDDAGAVEDAYVDADAEFDAPDEFGSEEVDEYLASYAAAQAPDEAARLNRSAAAILLGGKNTPCGICFSTGWTEGYQLQNGRRYTLDATNVEDAGGFSIDIGSRPNLFSGYTGTPAAVFTLDLPKYFKKCLIVRVFNNLQLAVGLKVEVQWPSSGTWVPLTAHGLNMRRNMDNRATKIRVLVNPDYPQEYNTVFTHVEIVLEYTVRPVGQMPNIESAETWELLEATTQTNIEWPATIGDMEFGSIVVDGKYKRAWRIISVTPQRTARGQVFSVETAAQKLQLFEPVALLNLFRSRHVILKNYKGLGTQR